MQNRNAKTTYSDDDVTLTEEVSNDICVRVMHDGEALGDYYFQRGGRDYYQLKGLAQLASEVDEEVRVALRPAWQVLLARASREDTRGSGSPR
jgi:hypothetical protein